VELEIVMPVFNEEACIAGVIEGWCRALDQLAVDYRLLALNDGSTDGTADVLVTLSRDPKVKVITKPGSGHGPTILAGYRLAVAEAEWVFQCDSDDEMKPEAFSTLWALRQTNDAVFGSRKNREQGIGRKALSAVSRVVVHAAYASGVDDVNTPFRLMRSSVLAPIIAAVPTSTFAPNLVVSGVLALSRVRIANVSVPHSNRRTGAVSIVKWRLVKAAASALVQTLRLAPKMRVVARNLATTRANDLSDTVVGRA
jgi:dolichol-phosphate mannosyltransferase